MDLCVNGTLVEADDDLVVVVVKPRVEIPKENGA